MIDIRQEPFFPWNFRFFGLIIMIGGLIFMSRHINSVWHILSGLVVMTAGLLIIVARYGLQVDRTNKTYRIYASLLGVKIGKAIPYERIEKLYINETSATQQLSSYGGQVHMNQKKIYKGFMKLSADVKIHLDTDKDRNKLEKRMQRYEIELLE